MRIGLTYDLRSEYLAVGYSEEETAEFDRAETIDAIDVALCTLGHAVDRIGHARQLVERLAAGDRWDLVFNIAEGLEGVAREAQVPAILDAFAIPYTFSDPLVLSLALDKALTKTVVRAAGIPTPDFVVVKSAADARRVTLPLPLFAKPIAEGTGKGIDAACRILDALALPLVCTKLLQRYQQPVLVERFLPGREFTVGLVGTGPQARVLGTLEIVLGASADPGVYSYENKEHCEQRVEYRLVKPQGDDAAGRAQEIALAAWKALGCRDAGRVDLRCDAHGAPHFLEVNPLAGLHPEHSDLPILCTKLGIDYTTLIQWIMGSARERMRKVKKREDANRGTMTATPS
jgi:D-alanine-D-alanine ligase